MTGARIRRWYWDTAETVALIASAWTAGILWAPGNTIASGPGFRILRQITHGQELPVTVVASLVLLLTVAGIRTTRWLPRIVFFTLPLMWWLFLALSFLVSNPIGWGTGLALAIAADYAGLAKLAAQRPRT